MRMYAIINIRNIIICCTSDSFSVPYPRSSIASIGSIAKTTIAIIINIDIIGIVVVVDDNCICFQSNIVRRVVHRAGGRVVVVIRGCSVVARIVVSIVGVLVDIAVAVALVVLVIFRCIFVVSVGGGVGLVQYESIAQGHVFALSEI